MARKNRIEELQSLLENLRRSEKAIVKSYFKALQSSGVKGYAYMSELVEYVDQGKGTEESDVLKAIGFESKRETDQGLFLKNVRDLILDFLSHEINTERIGNLTYREKGKIFAAKRLNQAKTLYSRGVKELAQTLFEEVLGRATREEHFREAADACRNLLLIYGAGGKTRTYHRLQEDLKDLLLAAECYEAIQDAFLDHSLVVGTNAEIEAESIQLALETVRKAQQSRETHFGRYMELLLSTRKFQLEDLVERAVTSAEALLHLIRSETVLYTKQREGDTLMTLSELEAARGDYAKARAYIEEAQPFFKLNSVEMTQIRERLAILALHMGDYKFAATYLKKQLKSTVFDNIPFAKSKLRYLEVAAVAGLGKTKTSADALSAIAVDATTSADVRYHAALSAYLVSLGSDVPTKAVAKKMRKKMAALLESFSDAEEMALNKRQKSIIRIVHGLEQHELNFTEVYQLKKTQIDRLGTRGGEYGWNPIGLEIQPFHKWYQAQMRAQKAAAPASV